MYNNLHIFIQTQKRCNASVIINHRKKGILHTYSLGGMNIYYCFIIFKIEDFTEIIFK